MLKTAEEWKQTRPSYNLTEQAQETGPQEVRLSCMAKGSSEEWARFADLAQSNIQSEHGITSSRPFAKQDTKFYVTFYVCVF